MTVRPIHLALLVAVPAAAAAGLLVPRGSASLTPAQAARAVIAQAGEIGSLTVAADGRTFAYADSTVDLGLYVARAVGEPSPRRLPVSGLLARDASLSPDGAHLAYRTPSTDEEGDAHRASITVLEVASSTTRELAPPRGLPRERIRDLSWSPDGTRLAYTRLWKDEGPAWQTEIAVVDLGSGESTVSYRVPDAAARAPAWSPDGGHLAFVLGHQVMLMGADGSGLRALTSFPAGTPAPGAHLPDPPAWSPDGRRIAVAVDLGECYRTYLIDVAAAEAEVAAGAGQCNMRPVWTPDGAGVVLLRLGSSTRTLYHLDVPSGEVRPIGLRTGVTYRYGFDAIGRLIVHGTPADGPSGIWRVELSGAAPVRLLSALDEPLATEWISVPTTVSVESSDGLLVPLQVFPRTCGARDRPGPALIWLHGGPEEDVSPRWYQEIQYAAASGATVVAVNYRGSTGNGRAYREMSKDLRGQIQDVLAAIDYAQTRPDVDPEQVFVLAVSFAAAIAYPVVGRVEPPLRGIIDWVGNPGPLAELVRGRTRTLPPILFINGSLDEITPRRHELARVVEALGGQVEITDVPEGHAFFFRPSRAAAVEAMGRFLRHHAEVDCE